MTRSGKTGRQPDQNCRASWVRLPLVLSLFLIYLETVYMIGIFRHLEWRGYLACLCFSVAAASLLSLLASWGRPAIRKIFLAAACSVLTVIFVAQAIYYALYTSLFSFYSMTAGTAQVMRFWGMIMNVVGRKWLLVLLFVLPLPFLVLVGIRREAGYRFRWKQRAWIGGLMLAAYLAGLGAARIPGNDLYSPWQVYSGVDSPALIAGEFGLMTAMRLDLRQEWLDGAAKLPETSTAGTTTTAAGTTTTAAGPSGSETSGSDPAPTAAPALAANQLKIDFAALAARETDPDIKAMHQYFQTVQPTLKNSHTGLFKGKNLILIVAESFTPMVIDKERTPALYRMAREGYQFTNFYTPIWPVSTSDGEYTTCTSLIPKEGIWSMTASAKNNLPFTIGRLLLAQGYRTQAYHNHSYTFYQRNLSHPNLGYEIFKAVGNGLEITAQWPESDLEMIGATTGDYLGQAPFATYYMTVSGHLEYNRYNAMVKKNWSAAEDLPYSDPVKAYLACNIELDKALQALFEDLEAAGEAENTVIALCSDHYPYGLSLQEISELKGHPVEENFELYKNAFLIWHPGIEPAVIDKPGSNLDILPTLANLFGLPFDSRLLMGRDLMSDEENPVIFANRSWLTRQGCYNSLTQTFKTFTGQAEPTREELQRITRLVDDRFFWSRLILERDYYASLDLD